VIGAYSYELIRSNPDGLLTMLHFVVVAKTKKNIILYLTIDELSILVI
jgi:hypothetical protein